jgi:Tol biopolymer transport system component
MRPLGRVVLAAVALPLIVSGCTSSSASAAPSAMASSATPSAALSAAAPSAIQTATPSPAQARVPLILYYTAVIPGSNGEFWVIAADGTGQRKIADGVEASWSRDGKTIHVVSVDDKCVPTLSDVPVDGGPARPIDASLQPGDSHFSWSPDDSQVVFYHWSKWTGFCGWTGWAFTCDDAASPCPNRIAQDLETIAAGGGSPRLLVAKLSGPDATWWAPDGKSVIVNDNLAGQDGPLERVSLATGAVTPLLSSTTLRSDLTISPDGSRIAYASGSGDPGTRLHVANIDGGADLDLGAAGGQVVGLAWSPDGSRLAALVEPLDAKGVPAAQNLVVFRPPNAAATKVYSPFDDTFMVLAWSADGTRIATEKRFGGIVVVGADGSDATELPNTDQAESVSWQP